MLPGKCLHEIFESRARDQPDRVAVRDARGQLTYGELGARARRLARRLRRAGVGPESLVGLCVDRTAELIVGLLGILEAGGAYLPIDPDYPAPRIRTLLADGAVATVVTVPRVAERLVPVTSGLVHVDAEADADDPTPGGDPAPAAPPVSDRNLAYVIHTSGSTGEPKGAMIEHRSAARLFTALHPRFRFEPDDVWSVFHSACFDFSVWEIWGALLFGGRLVMVPAEVARSPERFRTLLRAERVTVLSQTPSAFYQLAKAELAREGEPRSALRTVVFGGEALDLGLLRGWIDRHGDRRPELVNMYGITETTVHVTIRRIVERDVDAAGAGGGASPIGTPLADLDVELEAGSGLPGSDGVAGELLISGPGLARGYLRRPGLTAERFVPAASGAPGERRYRSGDRAVRTAGGELAFLGRADDQIKVRGFRIEPGEVETFLTRHPRVSRAIVLPRDHGEGDVRLVACLLPPPGPEPTAGEAAELIAELARRAADELPDHLRPSDYRVVSEVPTTPQGKVDRAALLRLPGLGRELPAAPPNPGTPVERKITAFAEEVLRLEGLAPDADLFDLGATSLAFVRILRATNAAFGVSLNGSELGDEATVARLARCVEAELGKAPSPPAEKADDRETAELLS
jgi:amino acid adenylation domain-containing protein